MTYYTYNGVKYCIACGNPDCPKVIPDATWRECPAQASQRLIQQFKRTR